mmetsp:Transcript_41965/g.48476  ORF Transcript_41965/g.48476 Transcript_41965/m.48476 type:complete len:351 (+) Transcript_41965:249-1301(+)
MRIIVNSISRNVYFLNVLMSFFFFFFLGLMGAGAMTAATTTGLGPAASKVGSSFVGTGLTASDFTASAADEAVGVSSTLPVSLPSSTLLGSCWVFFLRFNFGRVAGARFNLGRVAGAADDDDAPQEAPPPTGVLVGALKAGCSCFCFSIIASAVAKSGNKSSSSVSTFFCEDILDPHPVEIPPPPPPVRIRVGTHFPPPPEDADIPAAAFSNRDDVTSCSFFSFPSLIRCASRSIPSRAAANFAFVSSTRNFSTISACSLLEVYVFRAIAFVSANSLVVTPGGTDTAITLREVLAARAASSHCAPSSPSFVVTNDGSANEEELFPTVKDAKTPVVEDTSVFVVDIAGALT